jgi:PAS domain S-box-containing protein
MNDFMLKLPGVIYEYANHNDGHCGFTFISENCFKILGIEAASIIKDPNELISTILEEDRLSFDQAFNRDTITNTNEWSWEGRILVNGEIRWVETRSTVEVINGDTFCSGIILDISERKRKEQETELRYESLVEHLPLGVGVHTGGKLVFANRYAHQIMGAKPNELIGKSVLDLVHPDFRNTIIERISKVSKGESLPLLEEKFLRLDGGVIDVETGAIPFTYNGKPANQIIVRDITDRKIAEALGKKNETLFTQLFNSAPMGVVMLNEQGKVEQVNRGFKEMFGYELDQLKGKNLNDFIVPEELRNEGIDLNNIISANKIISVGTKRKHREGRLIDVLLYGVPVMLDNRTIGIYGVYVDITDRKKVEEELKVRNAELDNFVYKVSHDLRAPLSSILGLVNLAKLPGNDDNPMDYINIIGQKVEALDNFISDVLSHSKNLKMEIMRAKVDFNSIISRTFTDLNYLDGASDMFVYRSIDEVDFFSDPWRISEIFRNLVSNAIKYKQAVTNPEVRVNIAINDKFAQIRFSDNGIGIDEQSISRIFDMFYRATEQSTGSGIGLYIVKNAVEKLGGRITVESEVDKGTTFTILLPNLVVESRVDHFVDSLLQRS